MHWLDLTLPSPAWNLACEEALLDQCENGGPEVLRVWEAESPFVVLGYGNRLDEWVNRDACHRLGVPILRRCSGGGAVVQSHGCLNYAVVLRADKHASLASIPGANHWIMERQRQAVELALRNAASRSAAAAPLVGSVRICGDTDLAVQGRKCSGNAQRRHSQSLLFHGSLLWGLDVNLVTQCLRGPPRQPPYREGRNHADFLINLPVAADLLKTCLRTVWGASESTTQWPEPATAALVAGKYATDQWIYRW